METVNRQTDTYHLTVSYQCLNIIYLIVRANSNLSFNH